MVYIYTAAYNFTIYKFLNRAGPCPVRRGFFTKKMGLIGGGDCYSTIEIVGVEGLKPSTFRARI